MDVTTASGIDLTAVVAILERMEVNQQYGVGLTALIVGFCLAASVFLWTLRR